MGRNLEAPRDLRERPQCVLFHSRSDAERPRLPPRALPVTTRGGIGGAQAAFGRFRGAKRPTGAGAKVDITKRSGTITFVPAGQPSTIETSNGSITVKRANSGQ